VVVPTSTPGIPATYTLKSGEFPYCIARRFNVNPVELLNLSGLGQNSRPAAGTTLTIPQTGNPFPGDRTLRAHPTTYTIQSGDSIYEIACLFGDVSPEAIAYANSLAAPYDLSAGQTLQIP
jgi:LysM repeat protein